jgi:UDP-glucose 4-epimerase
MNALSAESEQLRAFYGGKTCLITGGLGFIGSTLAIALANLGVTVRIVDNMLADHGGNIFNVAPARDKVEVHYGDILSASAMNHLVQGTDVVFHLAGQVSHVLSMRDPFPDIDINIRGTTVVMEAVKHYAPNAVVVYTGTRGQYGSSAQLPVGEDAPTNPRGIYELTNLAAEKIVQIYGQNFGVRAALLRLTNIYGPRAQMKHSHFGVVNWFVRQILDSRPVKVFGDGGILRDFVYVDDAVRACLLAAATPQAYGSIFNVGDERPTSFLQLVESMIRVAGTGSYEFAEFTPERKAQEPGDFYSNIDRARRILGWEPTTELAQGLAQTFAYYREHGRRYWSAP